MAGNRLSRRTVLRSGAGVVAAGTLAAPMVHAQGTGGSLRFAFWDHWVPGGNDALKKLAADWGEKNRVNVSLDFINTTGNQLQLTAAAQAQSSNGHDGISLTPLGCRRLCRQAGAGGRRHRPAGSQVRPDQPGRQIPGGA